MRSLRTLVNPGSGAGSTRPTTSTLQPATWSGVECVGLERDDGAGERSSRRRVGGLGEHDVVVDESEAHGEDRRERADAHPDPTDPTVAEQCSAFVGGQGGAEVHDHHRTATGRPGTGQLVPGASAIERNPPVAPRAAVGTRPERERPAELGGSSFEVAEAVARARGLGWAHAVVGDVEHELVGGRDHVYVDGARVGVTPDVGERLAQHRQHVLGDGAAHRVDRAVEAHAGFEPERGAGVGDDGQELGT